MSIHYFGVQKFIAAIRVFYSTFYIETNNIKFNFVNYNFFCKMAVYANETSAHNFSVLLRLSVHLAQHVRIAFQNYGCCYKR